jgi:hypothetical protein
MCTGVMPSLIRHNESRLKPPAASARWHRAQALRIPANITLIDIPPSTPECNHAEKSWQYLKDNFLSHRLFPTYQDILEACPHAWNSILNEAGRIASPTSIRYLICDDT